MMNKKFVSVLSFFTFLIFPLSAEQIAFHADSMSGKTGSKSDTTTLSGNAFVKTETMEIKADSITLSGENFRYITASGNIDGKNTESKLDFTCGNMRYDRNTKIARLEDAVHMVDTENDVKADAQIIEYDQNTEIATMQINVSIKQKDNTCTSAFAIYRKKAQMLEMTGNPKIVQGEDSFRAQEISLNLDTQEIKLDGRVSGQVSDSKKSDEKEKTEANNSQPAETEKNSENSEGESTSEEKTDVSENENEGNTEEAAENPKEEIKTDNTNENKVSEDATVTETESTNSQNDSKTSSKTKKSRNRRNDR